MIVALANTLKASLLVSMMLSCVGCERACHTYCANLDALPEGDWFCWVCQENRDRELAGEEVVDLTAGTTAYPIVLI